MHIGIVAASFPNISETFILDQVTGLLDRGQNVHIIAHRSQEETYHPAVDEYQLLDNVTYYRDPATRFEELIGNFTIASRFGVRYPDCLVKTLKQNDFGLFAVEPFLGAEFDLVHSHFGPVSVLPSRLKQCGVVTAPLVVSFHGWGIRRGKEREADLYSDVFDQTDIILANSKATRDALLDFGAAREQVRIHRIGIDLSRFTDHASTQRNHLSEIHIVSVGRLSEEKGHRDAIQAVKRLKDDNPSLDIAYEIVGGGELAPELQSLIDRLGMTDTVSLLGRQPRNVVVRKLASADLYLHPSRSEGLGIALLEAQASGLPVVATRVGGIPEAVSEGESALLADPGDINGLQNNLQVLFDDSSKRVQMANHGREFVEEHYDNAKLTDELVEIYESLV